jgi:DNA-directed RNA polymerase subunit RPC12/RpoP
MSVKIPEVCEYCGGRVKLADASELHGPKARGKIYLCTNCNASVNVHPGTVKPMGTLANTVLKLKRQEAHRVFDAIWKTRGLTRSEAYGWLAARMGLPGRRAHIACFNIAQCDAVVRICKEHDFETEAA